MSTLGPIGDHRVPIQRDHTEELGQALIGGSHGKSSPKEDEPLREAFHDFVGQTFFGQLIASLRSTQGESAYFNGGRAEKIFQGQLDQQLAEHIADASAAKIADPMYHLFQLRQRP